MYGIGEGVGGGEGKSDYKDCFRSQKETPPGGLEPPTFRLTAERASQLRHGGINKLVDITINSQTLLDFTIII